MGATVAEILVAAGGVLFVIAILVAASRAAKRGRGYLYSNDAVETYKQNNSMYFGYLPLGWSPHTQHQETQAGDEMEGPEAIAAKRKPKRRKVG
jgi:hypothetical protein